MKRPSEQTDPWQEALRTAGGKANYELDDPPKGPTRVSKKLQRLIDNSEAMRSKLEYFTVNLSRGGLDLERAALSKQVTLGYQLLLLEEVVELQKVYGQKGWKEIHALLSSYCQLIPFWIWSPDDQQLDLTGEDVPTSLKPLGKSTSFAAVFHRLMNLQTQKRSAYLLPENEFSFLLSAFEQYSDNDTLFFEWFLELLTFSAFFPSTYAKEYPLEFQNLWRAVQSYSDFFLRLSVQLTTALTSLDHPLHEVARALCEKIGIDFSSIPTAVWITSVLAKQEKSDNAASIAYTLRQLQEAANETGDQWYQTLLDNILDNMPYYKPERALTSHRVEALIEEPTPASFDLSEAFALFGKYSSPQSSLTVTRATLETGGIQFSDTGLQCSDAEIKLHLDLQNSFFYLHFQLLDDQRKILQEFRYVIDVQDKGDHLLYLDVLDPESASPQLTDRLGRLAALVLTPSFQNATAREAHSHDKQSAVIVYSRPKQKAMQRQADRKPKKQKQHRTPALDTSAEPWTLNEVVRQVRTLPEFALNPQKSPEIESGIESHELEEIFTKIQEYNIAQAHSLGNLGNAKMLTFARHGENMKVWQLRSGKFRVLASVDPDDDLRAEIFFIARRRDVKKGKVIR